MAIELNMVSAMTLWSHKFGTVKGEKTEKAYVTNLLDNKGVIKGHFKAVSGGISWSYPQELMDYVKLINTKYSFNSVNEYLDAIEFEHLKML